MLATRRAGHKVGVWSHRKAVAESHLSEILFVTTCLEPSGKFVIMCLTGILTNVKGTLERNRHLRHPAARCAWNGFRIQGLGLRVLCHQKAVCDKRDMRAHNSLTPSEQFHFKAGFLKNSQNLGSQHPLNNADTLFLMFSFKKETPT